MPLKLTVTCVVDGKEETWPLDFTKEQVTIGRLPKNDVRIVNMAAGPEHARIDVTGDQVEITDLGSGSATLVDGRPVRPGEPVRLRIGSEIRIATYRILIGKPAEVLDENTSEKTGLVAMDMVRRVLQGLSKTEDPPTLVVLNGNDKGRKLELRDEKEYYLGRDSDCDLVLKHWSISRKHAMIRRAQDQVTVIDLDSKNHVFVNGQQVDKSRILRSGNVINVGGEIDVKFRSPLHSLLDSLDGIAPSSLTRDEEPPAPEPDVSDGTQVYTRPPEPAAPAKKSPVKMIAILAVVVLLVIVILLLL